MSSIHFMTFHPLDDSQLNKAFSGGEHCFFDRARLPTENAAGFLMGNDLCTTEIFDGLTQTGVEDRQ